MQQHCQSARGNEDKGGGQKTVVTAGADNNNQEKLAVVAVEMK
jgi:hypothetical protein